MSIFDKIIQIEKYKRIGLVNITTGFFALYVKKLFNKIDRGILIVTSNLYEANKIYQNINNSNAFLFQVDEIISNSISSSPELKLDRLNILKELVKDNKKIVITDINGYIKLLPSPNNFTNNIINIKVGDSISQQEIINKLFLNGYNRQTLVTQTGEIGIRGFVLDVFPTNIDNPIRIEFFGDEIESIKYFDINSQKTISKIESIKIYPNNEQYSEEENYSIYDYLDNGFVIFKDYNQIRIAYDRIVNDSLNFKDDEIDIKYNDFFSIKVNDYSCYLDFDSKISDLEIIEYLDFNTKYIEQFNEQFNIINKYINDCLLSNKTVIICLSSLKPQKLIENIDVSYVLTDENNIIEKQLNIINYQLKEGFIKDNYVFISELELFSFHRDMAKPRSNFKFSTRIKDLSKLEIGDYVVHNTHGIGVYNGIKTLKKNGLDQDYIEVLYDKGDKLYIPASKIELLSKYSGKEGYNPKINSLNSIAWTKTKQRVKEKIKYEASRLLKVQAERSLKKGFAFSKDTPMQLMFEQEFPYEMTKDQLESTAQIKQDMESIIPMDRILCGDVGYGKTEVAFRAIFKAVCDSKQVLYLCPTTLLSSQQYESALDRFKNFPVKIGLLNRFTSPKTSKEIVESLANGTIDIVFGTHRLLSNDIAPKDLGLLIVDEEQRFGVAHKEKIKELKSNIDILTLTATPIPRTMQMAILGLKNLSLIETPPKNRYAVQTYVLEENNSIIRNIIYKEISRNGQVFILYNYISDIEHRVRQIQMLVPDAKIIYAHGRMPKNELENRMNDFVNGKYNVLICTTIIETGIDIPNANSLIIYDADHFGLSQLYQIRGRVGRSDRIAYAYLMYNKGKVLAETAIKRLKVIKDFTELGSGFNIATRDLSIRGAGDILGSEQAGFIDDVGIDLYMKMLELEIKKLKGEKIDDDDNEENEEIPAIQVTNHIKDNYIPDNDLKIEIHKLINTINSLDRFNEVKLELEDRFGNIDNDMLIYMNEELFESLIKKLGIIKVSENNLYIELVFSKEQSELINYEDFFYKSISISKNFNFNYKNNQLYLKLNKMNLKEHPLLYLNKLLEKM